MVLSAGSAYAGPCNTGGKDAGSGPTPGATGKAITIGSADTREHPPTDTMNGVAGNKAMSAQDTQRQQQGESTAAQQAQAAFTEPARRSAVSFSSPTAPPQKCFQPNCVKNQSFSAPRIEEA
jgi:hypothetical protein